MATDAVKEPQTARDYAKRLIVEKRLFIYDPAKYRVVSALNMAFSEAPQHTFLAVTPDPMTAIELAICLKPALGEIYVVNSEKQFVNLLEFAKKAGLSADKDKDSVAKILKKIYPKVIISLSDLSGQAIFNGILFDDTSLNGIFSEYKNAQGKYAVSDLLADAEYDFVYFDEIYELFAFNKCKESGDTSVGKLNPIDYDVLHFNDDVFYTPLIKSYNRLKRLSDSAEMLLVYTGCLTEGKSVNLYAAKQLLVKNRTYELKVKTREYLTRENTDNLRYELKTALAKEGTIDQIMGYSGARFGDIDVLSDRVSEMIGFLSQQEVFLRFVKVYSDRCGSLGSVLSDRHWFDTMLDFIMDSDMNFAGCVYNMLFGDESEIEIANARTEDNIISVIESFGGIASRLTMPEFNLLSVKRLNSVFEYIWEKRHGSIITDSKGLQFTSVGINGILQNKYLSVFKALSANKNNKKSLLIVTSEDANVAKAAIQNLADKFGYAFVNDCSEFVDVSAVEKPIVAVIDILHFINTPFDYNAGAVVFAEIIPADRAFVGMMRKAANMSANPEILLCATNDNFSACLVKKYICDNYNITKICDDNDNINGVYCQQIKKLEKAYVLLREVMENTLLGDNYMSEMFKHIFNGINTQNAYFASDADFRLKKMKEVSRVFYGIIQNSITFVSGGDTITNVAPLPVTKMKFLRKSNLTREYRQSNYVFFGACIKFLRGMCAYSFNCADCPNYEKLRINDANDFIKNVKAFFKIMKEYTGDYRQFVESQAAERNIYSASGDIDLERHLGDIDQAVSAGEYSVRKILSEMKSKDKKIKKIMLHIEYEQIEKIRNAVYQVYIKVFGDYFDVIDDLMNAKNIGCQSIK